MANPSMHRKIFVIILGVSLAGSLVLLGLLFDWRLTTHAPAEPDPMTQSAPNRDYSGLGEPEIADSLKTDTGLDIKTLENQKIDEHTFDNEQQAVTAAAALSAAGRSDKALEVYQFIEKRYADTPKTAQFYDSAALAADETGNVTLGTAFLKKERRQIAEDATLDEATRKDELARLDAKLDLRSVR